MITFHGKIINKLNHIVKKITCLPNVNITDIMPYTSVEFVAYGFNRIIGSCIFYVMNENIEILWNIQQKWNSEFYGISNVDAFNTSVYVPQSMNAVYLLTS